MNALRNTVGAALKITVLRSRCAKKFQKRTPDYKVMANSRSPYLFAPGDSAGSTLLRTSAAPTAPLHEVPRTSAKAGCM